MNGLTRIFLVLLRLAIGWHFLFEGIEKIRSVDIIGPTETNRPFSSLAYLREAAGPAGEYYRGLVGDPDQQALELFAARPLAAGEDPAVVPARQRIAPALEKAWDEYFQRFVDKYEITGLQLKETQARLDQAKDQAVRWLLGETQNGRVSVTEIEKSFFGSAPVKIKETSLERINEYRDKVTQLQQMLNEKFPAFGRDVDRQKLPALKADVNRLRNELLAELEKPMQESLASVLTDEQRSMGPITVPHIGRLGEWRQWDRLDWIDGLTRFGITAIGACLLLGLFTRSACLGGAVFLLLVYLAMPALPWLPDNPRAEGHYLYVNKNIIEMLALLTLATTRSGRWVGLDGLLPFLLPWRWRRRHATQSALTRGSSPRGAISD